MIDGAGLPPGEGTSLLTWETGADRRGPLQEALTRPRVGGIPMNILVTASQTLVGLFVDDGSLAIAILMIALVSGIFSILTPDMVPEADIKLLTQTLPSPSSLPGRIEALEPSPK